MPITIQVHDAEVQTSSTGKYKYIFVRMFFNGILCAVTAADKPGYWGDVAPKRMYEIWDTWSMLTSEGDGMNDVLRVESDELIIRSKIGNFRVRKLKPLTDEKIYGTNNYKGIFLEPITNE